MPWNVCLDLAVDDNYNIFWQSQRTSLHSHHLRKHNQVAICVFSDMPEYGEFGLYVSATAAEVTDAYELKRLLEIKYAASGQRLPHLDEFLGSADMRMYYAEVQTMWATSDDHDKHEVDLAALRRISGLSYEQYR